MRALPQCHALQEGHNRLFVEASFKIFKGVFMLESGTSHRPSNPAPFLLLYPSPSTTYPGYCAGVSLPRKVVKTLLVQLRVGLAAAIKVLLYEYRLGARV